MHGHRRCRCFTGLLWLSWVQLLYTVILNEIAINGKARDKENIENKLKFMLVWENETWKKSGKFRRFLKKKNNIDDTIAE